MPFEHQVTPWEASLFQMAEDNKQLVGFDGSFTLPTEQRILLDAAQAGRQQALMQVIQHLKLDRAAARRLYFELIGAPAGQSVQEAERYFQELRRP